VKAAIGELIENEELGGAVVQCDISGVVDRRHPDDASCLRALRASLAQVGRDPVPSPFARAEPRPPAYAPDELYGLVPADRARPYDMREILARLLDGSELEEYKPTYGRSLICGWGRLDGWALGVVANQRLIVERRTGTAAGDRELQIGGVLYSDSADKAARFVELCNQKHTPLLFVQDVTGFMVGSRAERGGIIKDGAKLVNAVANSVVPKLTLFVGNSFGAGNYAMCGKAYGARLLWAWPSAAISVMGPDQASSTLLSIQLRNREVSEAEKAEHLRDIRARYEAAMDPRYAASRLWVDGIVDPASTREVLAASLRAACHNPHLPPFRTGVLQT
jgi:acetyl-CoA carboxylase carboxyltransferase component